MGTDNNFIQNKHAVKYNLIVVFIAIVLFLAAVIFQNKIINKKFQKTVHIAPKDSFSLYFLKNESFYYNRGTFIFKNKYLLSQYEADFDTIMSIFRMKPPLSIIKKKDNDTIFFLNNKEKHYVILKDTIVKL